MTAIVDSDCFCGPVLQSKRFKPLRLGRLPYFDDDGARCIDLVRLKHGTKNATGIDKHDRGAACTIITFGGGDR